MALSTTAALTLIGAGSAVSALGAIQQGRAAAAQARFQAAVQEQQATREQQLAEQREQDFRRRQSREMASRRAILGASGVEASAGSPLLVSEDFAGETELQALRIRNQGEVTATRLEQQAQLTRMQGRAARTAGFFRAGSSLLSGFGRVGYYSANPQASVA